LECPNGLKFTVRSQAWFKAGSTQKNENLAENWHESGSNWNNKNHFINSSQFPARAQHAARNHAEMLGGSDSKMS
jgi:hypothetical protein